MLLACAWDWRSDPAWSFFPPVKVPDVQDPKRCTVKVSEDGAGLGEDGVKFPLLEPVQSGKTKP